MKKFIVFFTVCLCLVGCGKIGRGVSKVKVKAPKVKDPKGTKTDKSFGQIAAEEIGKGLLGEGIDAANNSPTHSNAQNTLGIKYFNKKDYKEAAKWFRKSAEQGNAYGQSNLGLLYLKGNGVLKNDKEAEKWFRKSAEQGNDYGQVQLGLILSGKAEEKGITAIGFGKELMNESLLLFSKAALQGNKRAQRQIGYFYNEQNKTLYPWPKNNKLAYAWFSIAKLNGDEELEATINTLEKRMSQYEIDEAQATAATILKKYPKARK